MISCISRFAICDSRSAIREQWQEAAVPIVISANVCFMCPELRNVSVNTSVLCGKLEQKVLVLYIRYCQCFLPTTDARQRLFPWHGSLINGAPTHPPPPPPHTAATYLRCGLKGHGTFINFFIWNRHFLNGNRTNGNKKNSYLDEDVYSLVSLLSFRSCNQHLRCEINWTLESNTGDSQRSPRCLTKCVYLEKYWKRW